jgi:hypothetical protein
MNTSTQWVFSQLGFNNVEQEVTEADQFNTEAVPETEALVREAAQNSQDARLKNGAEPVRLRIGLIDADSGLDGMLLKELTADLHPHLLAAGFQVDPVALERPSALAIEDFGTEGLTGKIDDDSDQGNFRSFWFRHGGSFKKGSKNGRWGLGKLVFPIMSASRCFFGLTVRQGDPAPLLLGQAVLKTHRLDGIKHAPHGHYGDVSQGGDLRPVTDASFIERFRCGFGLLRTAETGLSVVVPYPAAETDLDGLLKFVVQNYAFPILTGRLIVDVMGEVVNAACVRKIGEELLEPGLIQFIDDVHAANRAGLIKVKSRKAGSTDRLTEKLIDASLPDLRARYAAGELLGFEVPVMLARKNGSTHTASFVEVFLRSGAEGQNGDAIYVRGDITVPEEAKQFHGAGAFAAMLAQEATVSEFLADAENPAHTKWAGTMSRLRANWKYPPQTLSLIRNAPVALHKLLATGREEMDENALINFFWIDDPSAPPGKSGGPKPKKPDGPEPKPVPPDLPEPKKRLILTKRKGGFTIKPGPDFHELPLPAGVKVVVRYDVEYGEPRWDKFDFDFGEDELAISVTGAEDERRENTILLTVEEPDFSLSVDGFDERRDLLVDYNIVKVREVLDA